MPCKATLKAFAKFLTIRAQNRKRALTLMKRRFGNISEIALEVGYQNPSYFTKCFQKNFGCKPSEFIRISNYA